MDSNSEIQGYNVYPMLHFRRKFSSGVTATRRLRGCASTSSLSIVLGSPIVNTVNLFTGDWGALIASCVMQNPLLLGDQTPLTELHLSMPTNLQSTPSIAPK